MCTGGRISQHFGREDAESAHQPVVCKQDNLFIVGARGAAEFRVVMTADPVEETRGANDRRVLTFVGESIPREVSCQACYVTMARLCPLKG
jgi:hypothetical protein